MMAHIPAVITDDYLKSVQSVLLRNKDQMYFSSNNYNSGNFGRLCFEDLNKFLGMLNGTYVTELVIKQNNLAEFDISKWKLFANWLSQSKISVLQMDGNDLSSVSKECLSVFSLHLKSNQLCEIDLSRNYSVTKGAYWEPEDIYQLISNFDAPQLNRLVWCSMDLYLWSKNQRLAFINGLKASSFSQIDLSHNGLNSLEVKELEQWSYDLFKVAGTKALEVDKENFSPEKMQALFKYSPTAQPSYQPNFVFGGNSAQDDAFDSKFIYLL